MRRGQLPLLIRRGAPAHVWLFFLGPGLLLYQLAGRLPFRPPVELPMTGLDSAIPFVPLSIPVYVSWFLFAAAVVARVRDDAELNLVLYRGWLQVALAAVFFFVWPVAFPRHLFYSRTPATELFGWLWGWFDGPGNCFPSLHTSTALLGIHHSLGRPHAALFGLWGGAIVASTLLAKQHYAIDIPGGIGVYLASLVLVGRRHLPVGPDRQ